MAAMKRSREQTVRRAPQARRRLFLKRAYRALAETFPARTLIAGRTFSPTLPLLCNQTGPISSQTNEPVGNFFGRALLGAIALTVRGRLAMFSPFQGDKATWSRPIAAARTLAPGKRTVKH